MDTYLKILEINSIPIEYPFDNKIEDNIEFTKKELELFYIKAYDKCITEKQEKRGGGNKIQVFI